MTERTQSAKKDGALPFDGREILDQLYDGVYLVDRSRVIRSWNKGAERLAGYPASEVIGTKCADGVLMHVDEAGDVLCPKGCPLEATMADGQLREAEVYLHHKDGHRVPVVVRASPIRDGEGRIVGAIEVFSDNSARSSLRSEIESLKRLALYDPLTEVGNRRYLDITLMSRHDELERYGWPYGLLLFDVDRFKVFNDRFGHAAGDRALRMVARTVAANVRTFDVVGRWGGEEFLVVLEKIEKNELRRRGEALRRLVEASSVSFEGNELSVTVSAGGTIARPSESVDETFQRADELLYRSKSEGRNRCTFV